MYQNTLKCYDYRFYVKSVDFCWTYTWIGILFLLIYYRLSAIHALGLHDSVEDTFRSLKHSDLKDNEGRTENADDYGFEDKIKLHLKASPVAN